MGINPIFTIFEILVISQVSQRLSYALPIHQIPHRGIWCIGSARLDRPSYASPIYEILLLKNSINWLLTYISLQIIILF